MGIESSHDQAVVNGGLQIWSFLVAVGFSSFLVDVLGRRMLFMIAAIGMLVSFSIWTGYAFLPLVVDEDEIFF